MSHNIPPRPDIPALINRISQSPLDTTSSEIEKKIQFILQVNEDTARRLKNMSLIDTGYTMNLLAWQHIPLENIIEKYKNHTLQHIIVVKHLWEQAIIQIEKNMKDGLIENSEGESIIQSLAIAEEDIKTFLEFFQEVIIKRRKTKMKS